MKIVVLSRKSSLYSTRRLVEAAQERSHDVRVLDHMKCYSVIESGNPHVHYNDEELKDVDAVIPRIGASVTFYGAAVVRQFEMMNVFTVSSSDGIIRSRDKLRSLQILTRSGVHLPKTVFVSRTREVGNLIRQVGGAPCVIKLLEGTQGVGVVLAETPKAARSVIEAFFGMKARIIIQEYIEEAGGSDIRAFVVDDEVVGAMRRTGKEGEFRSNIHRGGKAESIELTPDQRDTALRAARAMGLQVAGVDMIEAERGPAVLEVNSSPGLEGIENATGVNIAGRIVEFIEQEVAPPVSASDDGNP